MENTGYGAANAKHNSTDSAANSFPPHIGSNGYPSVVPPLPGGGVVNEKHRQELEIGSAIGAAEIETHGFFSLPSGHASRSWLKNQGFSDAQAAIGSSGCLVIPRYDCRGKFFGYQIKPDHPRNDGRKNKPIKYEVPKGSAVHLDAPPADIELLKDASIPLALTEGIKKLVSAKSHGLLCVSVNGVHAFLGKNDRGGHSALADLDEIAWKGINDKGSISQLVLLTFDSDVTEKDTVHNALIRIGGLLANRGATVKMVTLPAGTNDMWGLQTRLSFSGLSIMLPFFLG